MKKFLLTLSLITSSVMLAQDTQEINKEIENYHKIDAKKILEQKYLNHLKELNENIKMSDEKFNEMSKSRNFKEIKEEIPLLTKETNTSSKLYSPVNAKLITGVMFPKKDIINEKNLENGVPLIIEDNNNCKYLGKSFYNIDTERATINLTKKSCLIDKKRLIKDIDGFVTEKDFYGVSTEFLNFKNGFYTLNSGKEVKVIVTKIY